MFLLGTLGSIQVELEPRSFWEMRHRLLGLGGLQRAHVARHSVSGSVSRHDLLLGRSQAACHGIGYLIFYTQFDRYGFGPTGRWRAE